MTWQRIDENTYIDDSLVTCAEYQLFIDEMRQQGKYYQPDHWTMYQFPKGKASEPILGVRHSDAVAFCEWLNYREDKSWKFRLPTQQEIGAFPVTSLGRNVLAYWIYGEYQLAWLGISKDVYAFDLERTSKKADSLSKVLDYALDLERAHRVTRDYSSRVESARDNAHGLANSLGSALVRYLRSAPVRTQSHVYRLIQSMDIYRSPEDRLASNVANVRNINRDLDMRITGVFGYNADRACDNARTLVIDISKDLFTIQERIAGRSPAFEGIRLVKERTR